MMQQKVRRRQKQKSCRGPQQQQGPQKTARVWIEGKDTAREQRESESGGRPRFFGEHAVAIKKRPGEALHSPPLHR